MVLLFVLLVCFGCVIVLCLLLSFLLFVLSFMFVSFLSFRHLPFVWLSLGQSLIRAVDRNQNMGFWAVICGRLVVTWFAREIALLRGTVWGLGRTS